MLALLTWKWYILHENFLKTPPNLTKSFSPFLDPLSFSSFFFSFFHYFMFPHSHSSPVNLHFNKSDVEETVVCFALTEQNLTLFNQQVILHPCFFLIKASYLLLSRSFLLIKSLEKRIHYYL